MMYSFLVGCVKPSDIQKPCMTLFTQKATKRGEGVWVRMYVSWK